MSKIRRPAVAGYFYPRNPDELINYIFTLFKKGPGEPKPVIKSERNIIGIVSPHAGYMYSGWIAVYGYYHVAADGLPKNIILIGPNHTGLGTAISVYPGDYWETPLGIVQVDVDLGKGIAEYHDLISLDEDAHINEHSLEVQIPFIQFLYRGFDLEYKILPITMMLQNIEAVKILGEAIYQYIKDSFNNYLIIASTDFTHYEPAESARRKDKYVIDAILNCDPEALINNVYMHDVSMCGYGPVATLLYVGKLLGRCNVSLLKYGNSGDITGDYSSVVAYASFKIEK